MSFNPISSIYIIILCMIVYNNICILYFEDIKLISIEGE